jgi:hypothetical protein
MTPKERIEIDIEKFKESLNQISQIELSTKDKEILEKAKQYCEDSKYYLKKGDEFTSFGCITYCHGLIDALQISHKLI